MNIFIFFTPTNFKLIDSLWKSIEGINKEGCHPFENLYPFSGNIVSSSNNKHSAKCRQPMLNNEVIFLNGRFL